MVRHTYLLFTLLILSRTAVLSITSFIYLQTQHHHSEAKFQHSKTFFQPSLEDTLPRHHPPFDLIT